MAININFGFAPAGETYRSGDYRFSSSRSDVNFKTKLFGQTEFSANVKWGNEDRDEEGVSHRRGEERDDQAGILKSYEVQYKNSDTARLKLVWSTIPNSGDPATPPTGPSSTELTWPKSPAEKSTNTDLGYETDPDKQPALGDSSLPVPSAVVEEPAQGVPSLAVSSEVAKEPVQHASSLPVPSAVVKELAQGVPSLAVSSEVAKEPVQYASSLPVPSAVAKELAQGVPSLAVSSEVAKEPVQRASSLPVPSAVVVESAQGVPSLAVPSEVAKELVQHASSLPVPSAVVEESAQGVPSLAVSSEVAKEPVQHASSLPVPSAVVKELAQGVPSLAVSSEVAKEPVQHASSLPVPSAVDGAKTDQEKGMQTDREGVKEPSLDLDYSMKMENIIDDVIEYDKKVGGIKGNWQLFSVLNECFVGVADRRLHFGGRFNEVAGVRKTKNNKEKIEFFNDKDNHVRIVGDNLKITQKNNIADRKRIFPLPFANDGNAANNKDSVKVYRNNESSYVVFAGRDDSVINDEINKLNRHVFSSNTAYFKTISEFDLDKNMDEIYPNRTAENDLVYNEFLIKKYDNDMRRYRDKRDEDAKMSIPKLSSNPFVNGKLSLNPFMKSDEAIKKESKSSNKVNSKEGKKA